MAQAPPGNAMNCAPDATAIAFWFVCCFGLLVTTILVPLRVYTRVFLARAFGWDDATLIVSYVLLVPGIAPQIKMLALGLGQPEPCVSPAAVLWMREWSFIAQMFGIYSEVFARVSTAILLIRLFGVSNRVRYLIIACITLQILVVGTTGILIWFQCRPTRAMWDQTIEDPHCWSSSAQQALACINGVTSIISDLVVVVIPAYFMTTLRVAKRFKFLLVSLFAITLMPSACAIVRMKLYYAQSSPDFLRVGAELGIPWILEQWLLVTCASLLALPALFKKQSRHQGTTPTPATASSGLTRPLRQYSVFDDESKSGHIRKDTTVELTTTSNSDTSSAAGGLPLHPTVSREFGRV